MFKDIFYFWSGSGGYMNRRVLIGQKINCKDDLENFKQGDMLKKGERKVAEVSQDERNS